MLAACTPFALRICWLFWKDLTSWFNREPRLPNKHQSQSMSTQPVTAQHNSVLFDLLWAGVTFLFLYIQVEYSCLCSPLEVKAFKLVPDFQSSFGLNLLSHRPKHQECVSLSRRALRLKNRIVVYCSKEQKALIPQCHKYLCYDKSLWLLPSLCGGRVKTTPVFSRLSFLRFLSYASKCIDRSSGVDFFCKSQTFHDKDQGKS